MKKLSNKRVGGFASILPLLVITVLIISSFAVYNQSKAYLVPPKNVLSESDKESESSETLEPVETPELVETTEPQETPESVETPEPKQTETENEVEVKNGTNESKIKIRANKNKFEFQQEGVKLSVESDFPLSVNPNTKELTVTTPAGSKTVAILPQQAINNMLASGVITTTTGINLKTETDGSLSYNIDGTKNEKLLGTFSVAIPKNLIVSTETGQVLSVNQSTFSKILDFLSI